MIKEYHAFNYNIYDEIELYNDISSFSDYELQVFDKIKEYKSLYYGTNGHSYYCYIRKEEDNEITLSNYDLDELKQLFHTKKFISQGYYNIKQLNVNDYIRCKNGIICKIISKSTGERHSRENGWKYIIVCKDDNGNKYKEIYYSGGMSVSNGGMPVTKIFKYTYE